ncbi:hypothetical protein JCM10212_004721 [Sporobolomyces blumeae]
MHDPASASASTDTRPLLLDADQYRHSQGPSAILPDSIPAARRPLSNGNVVRSSLSAVPPSPTHPAGLLLFRRRSSFGGSQEPQLEEANLHPIDVPPADDPDSLASRRSSAAQSSSSALGMIHDGPSSSRRRTSVTTSVGDWANASANARSASTTYLPPPSSLGYAQSPNRLLFPIEASPRVSEGGSSSDSTPTCSVDLTPPRPDPQPSYSKPRPMASHPPDPVLPRRPSYAVVDLVSQRANASLGPPLVVPQSLKSARSFKRHFGRLISLASIVCMLYLFISPTRQSTRTHIVAQVERSIDSDPESLAPRVPRTPQDHVNRRKDVATRSDPVGVDEVRKFREANLWAPPPAHEKLKMLVVDPKPSATHEATVIMCHGLSQRIEDSWLHHELAPKLPGVRWVMPQARAMPVTYHDGELRAAWFDIQDFPWNAIEDSDTEHYYASARHLNAIIRSERDRLVRERRAREGNESDGEATSEERAWASRRILLGGFSQGGVMSLLTGLTQEEELAGLFAFSAMLPIRELLPELVRDLNRTNVPLFWAHGRADPYLLERDAAASIDALHAPSPGLALSRVTYKTYADLPHTYSRPEIAELLKWIENDVALDLTTPGGQSRHMRWRRVR